MSTIKVDTITNVAGTGAPTAPYGIVNSNPSYWTGFVTALNAAWSTNSSTFADPAIGGGTNALTTVLSKNLSIAAAAGNLCGITFTPESITAGYLILFGATIQPGSNTNVVSARLYDGTSVIDTSLSSYPTVAGTAPFVKMGGLYIPGTLSPVTVKTQLAMATSGTTTIGSNASTLVPAASWQVIRLF